MKSASSISLAVALAAISVVLAINPITASAASGHSDSVCPSLYFTIPVAKHVGTAENCSGNILPHVFVGGSAHQLWFWQTTHHRSVEMLYGRSVIVQIIQRGSKLSVKAASILPHPVKIRIRFGPGTD